MSDNNIQKLVTFPGLEKQIWSINVPPMLFILVGAVIRFVKPNPKIGFK